MKIMRNAATASVLMVALAGCHGFGHDAETPKAQAGQVVAKVNDHEISVYELNSALAQVAPQERGADAAANRLVLDRLIDQHILADQAVSKKLDRDPRVLQMLEGAKRQVLATAYMESLAQGAKEPTATDIDAFYTGHPELFSARRVYSVRRLQLGGHPSMDHLQQVVSASKDLPAVIEQLKSEKVPFAESVINFAPEQVPLKAAVDLSHAKVGDLLVLAGGDGAESVIQIIAAQTAPVDHAQASQAIGRFITNQRRSELLANSIKALRASAKVAYLGQFAPGQQGGADANAPTITPVGNGVVTVPQKSLQDAPSGVVTSQPGSAASGSSGVVTVDPHAAAGPSGVITVAPGSGKK